MVKPEHGVANPRRSNGPRRIVWASALLLAACAQPLRQPMAGAGAEGHWNGRLALTIQSEPVQSMSAGFELSGKPSQGELQLFSPLGNTLALLSWSPTTASLKHDAQEQTSDSLDDLVIKATGAELPLRALFDWLSGRPAQVAGWQADLSQLADGRLQVHRTAPAPTVDLRIKLTP